MMRSAMYVLGLLGAATVLVWVDQSPSDIANQASLLVLVLGAAVLGLAAPRRAWLSALILGVCLPCNLPGGRRCLPLRDVADRLGSPATLLILIIPAGLAAYLGAGTTMLVRSLQQARL